MSTQGRIFEYFKVKQFEVMVAEIIPMELPIYCNEKCFVTSKWIDFIMWQEIYSLINEVISECLNDVNKIYKFKKGSSVIIGYKFQDYKPSSGIYLKPRENDDVPNPNLLVKDELFVFYKEFKYSIVVSIYPTKLNTKGFKLSSSLVQDFAPVTRLLIDFSNQHSTMWTLNKASRHRVSSRNLNKSQDLFAVDSEILGSDFEYGSVINSVLPPDDDDIDDYGLFPFETKEMISEKNPSLNSSEVENNISSNESRNNFENMECYDDFDSLIGKKISHRHSKKSSAHSSVSKSLSRTVMNENKKHDKTKKRSRINNSESEKKQKKITSFFNGSSSQTSESRDRDDFVAPAISKLLSKSHKIKECKEKSKFNSSPLRDGKENKIGDKKETCNMPAYCDTLNTSLNLNECLYPLPKKKCARKNGDASMTDKNVLSHYSLRHASSSRISEKAEMDDSNSLPNFLDDSIVDNRSLKINNIPRRSSHVSDFDNDLDLPNFMDDDISDEPISKASSSFNSLFNNSNSLKFSNSLNCISNSSPDLFAEKFDESQPSLSVNSAQNSFSLNNTQDELPDLMSSQYIIDHGEKKTKRDKRKVSSSVESNRKRSKKSVKSSEDSKKTVPKTKHKKSTSETKSKKNHKSKRKSVDRRTPVTPVKKSKLGSAENSVNGAAEYDKPFKLSPRTLQLCSKSFSEAEEDFLSTDTDKEDPFIKRVYEEIRSLTFNDLKSHFEKNLPYFKDMILGNTDNERDKKIREKDNCRLQSASEAFVTVLDENLFQELSQYFTTQLGDLMETTNKNISVVMYNILVILPELLKRIFLSSALAQERGIKNDEDCEEIFFQITLHAARNSP